MSYEGLHKGRSEKSLTVAHKKHAGRNSLGRITVRHKSSGHKSKYRIIDFKRVQQVPGKVTSIEKDPNRNALISLVTYENGAKSYVIHTKGLNLGDTIYNVKSDTLTSGSSMKLIDIPVGTTISCLELKPGQGAQLIRSAGAFGTLVNKEGDRCAVKLPSGKLIRVLAHCRAVIGQVSNEEIKNTSLGKAGRKRWLGIRPTVRGVAMNPVDHPHGGGEGRTSGGRHPVTPWGIKTKGKKTAKKSNRR